MAGLDLPAYWFSFPSAFYLFVICLGFFFFFSYMWLLKVNHNGILDDININVLFRGKIEWKEYSRLRFEACWVQGATCDVISPLGVVVLHVCCNKPGSVLILSSFCCSGEKLDLHWANKDLKGESGPSHVGDVFRWQHVMSLDLPS